MKELLIRRILAENCSGSVQGCSTGRGASCIASAQHVFCEAACEAVSHFSSKTHATRRKALAPPLPTKGFCSSKSARFTSGKNLTHPRRFGRLKSILLIAFLVILLIIPAFLFLDVVSYNTQDLTSAFLQLLCYLDGLPVTDLIVRDHKDRPVALGRHDRSVDDASKRGTSIST